MTDPGGYVSPRQKETLLEMAVLKVSALNVFL